MYGVYVRFWPTLHKILNTHPQRLIQLFSIAATLATLVHAWHSSAFICIHLGLLEQSTYAIVS